MGRRPNNGPSFSGGSFSGSGGLSNRDYFQNAFAGIPPVYRTRGILPIEALFPKKKIKKTAKELTTQRLERTERLLREISDSNKRKKARDGAAKKMRDNSTSTQGRTIDKEKLRRDEINAKAAKAARHYERTKKTEHRRAEMLKFREELKAKNERMNFALALFELRDDHKASKKRR